MEKRKEDKPGLDLAPGLLSEIFVHCLQSLLTGQWSVYYQYSQHYTYRTTEDLEGQEKF